MSDSALNCTLRPTLRKKPQFQKVMCGCEVFIYTNNMHEYLLNWRENHLKRLDRNSYELHRLMYVYNCDTIYSKYR